MQNPSSMDEVFLADAPSRGRHDDEGRTAPRGWAWSGVAAGVLDLVVVQTTMSLWNEDLDYGDAGAVADQLSTQTTPIVIAHTAMLLGLVALIVFALGLVRRLSAALPRGSLLGGVAGAGIGLVAVAQMMGSGLDTEFLFAGADVENNVAENLSMYNHWIATIPWLWVGAGLAGVAVAIAALRHRAVPRWIGLVGALLGGLTLVLGISPLQYMAGFVGPLWLLVTALGFALDDRAYRAGA